MTRRTFVLGSISGGVGVLLLKDRSLFAQTLPNGYPAASEQALRFPPVFSGSDLVIGQTSVNIWTDKPTNALTFNGSFPGPTIIVRRGDTFSAKIVNQLNVPSVIHWHGLIAPELMDGHPKDQIGAGMSADISFPILNRAGTYFYHSHADEETASQVYKGLAGFFIVEDPNEISFGLPSGIYDVPLLIQDKRTNANRDLVYSPSMMDTMSGWLGTDILINGTPDAYLDISPTLYRLRLLNGSNARIYKIAFSDRKLFHVIGSDGGLLDKAVQATSVFISPGERLDILADFSANSQQSLYLKSLEFPYGGMSMSGTPQGTEMNLLKFNVIHHEQSGGIVPGSLVPYDPFNSADSKRTRTFSLGTSGMQHTINEKTFSMNRIDETVKLGDLERWDFMNTGDETHPMHIHGAQFQVVERDGKPVSEPTDLGWKDTVMVPEMSNVSILVRFDEYAGRYLLHCHNLEHEDTGMMLNIQVLPSAGVESDDRIEEKLTITPNPANRKATLQFEELESDTLLEVIDFGGKVLYRTNLKKGEAILMLDTLAFPNGEYLVRLGQLVKHLAIIR